MKFLQVFVSLKCTVYVSEGAFTREGVFITINMVYEVLNKKLSCLCEYERRCQFLLPQYT